MNQFFVTFVNIAHIICPCCFKNSEQNNLNARNQTFLDEEDKKMIEMVEISKISDISQSYPLPFRKSQKKSRPASKTQVYNAFQRNQQENQIIKTTPDKNQNEGSRDSVKTLKKNNSSKRWNYLKMQQLKSQKSQRESRRSNDVESFYSISCDNSPSKKNFKVLSKKSLNMMNSLKSSKQDSISKYSGSEQFKSIKGISKFDKNNSVNQQSQNQRIINSLYDAFRAQYPKNRKDQIFQMEQSILARVQRHSFLDSLVNKLEDFYVFYSDNIDSQSNSRYNPYTLRYENGNFRCHFVKQLQNMSNKTKYMNLITFQSQIKCITFLKWFNTLEVQSKLHNMNKFNVSFYEQWPIFFIEQFSIKGDLMGRRHYTTICQVQKIQFEDTTSQYLVQIDVSLLKDCYFERIVRIQVSEKPMVQIYFESSEHIIGQQSAYFQNTWKQFQQKLKKNGAIVVPNGNFIG